MAGNDIAMFRKDCRRFNWVAIVVREWQGIVLVLGGTKLNAKCVTQFILWSFNGLGGCTATASAWVSCLFDLCSFSLLLSGSVPSSFDNAIILHYPDLSWSS